MNELPLIDWILFTALGWLLIGVIGVAFPRNFLLNSRVLFPLGAIFGLALALLALTGNYASPQVRILPLGMPGPVSYTHLDVYKRQTVHRRESSHTAF